MARSNREAVAEQLHSAAIRLLRRVRKVDGQSGVPPARLSALSVLVFGGAATLGELAEAEDVKRPTITKIVQGLEEAGLVARTPGPDARSAIVSATPEGKRVLERARTRRIALFTKMLDDATPAELAVLEKSSRVLGRLLS